MTFNSNMELVQQEAIPELYIITAGGYSWRYTSYKEDLTFLGNTYRSASIKRSAFTKDRQLGSSKTTISAAFTDPLKRYLRTYPLPSTTVTIYRAVATSLTDYALLFTGTVHRTTISGRVITAELIQGGKIQTRLPHIVYQSYCNWVLFDCYCGLNAADWDVLATVTIDGADLVSSTFDLYDDGYFSQGRAYYDGDYRWITNHVGSTITLQVPFGSELISGGTVRVYPGCDGAPSTCRSKFNNFTVRHVSMPYIPTHNPTVWGFK